MPGALGIVANGLDLLRHITGGAHGVARAIDIQAVRIVEILGVLFEIGGADGEVELVVEEAVDPLQLVAVLIAKGAAPGAVAAGGDHDDKVDGGGGPVAAVVVHLVQASVFPVAVNKLDLTDIAVVGQVEVGGLGFRIGSGVKTQGDGVVLGVVIEGNPAHPHLVTGRPGQIGFILLVGKHHVEGVGGHKTQFYAGGFIVVAAEFGVVGFGRRIGVGDSGNGIGEGHIGGVVGVVGKVLDVI